MEQVLVHVSWLTEEQLQGKSIIHMCKNCGNDNHRHRECPNCDIAFENYVYMDQHPLDNPPVTRECDAAFSTGRRWERFG